MAAKIHAREVTVHNLGSDGDVARAGDTGILAGLFYPASKIP